MLKVAILSDNSNAAKLKEYIVRYSIYYNFDIGIYIYTDIDDILTFIDSKSVFNIIFLNIDLDAFKVMYHLRKKLFDEDTSLIFISKEAKCSANLIKFHPFDFLVYPISYSMVSECISNYYKINDARCKLFSYISNKSEHMLAVSKIMYLQSKGRKIIIHTKNDRIEFYGKLYCSMHFSSH